ncbi:DUF4097 family beta strand repeat-containing protein [Kangiella sp. HZ709]|uniref:DUF4097 family beta strand repeat-containing protein n=1 Tax=Kangiella sp. HZ709 TaxID=2666328 RepID=UPI0012AF1D76|nr:DUF4097 family beta strand repeat-containing protein [Kangiella sp. HZ709]MRX28669.1 DUF4097 family beta strand repeat protein [Kangiella sp. HZ709]
MNKLTKSVLALAATTLSFGVFADVEREFSETYNFSSNGTVRVENINGNIKLEGWDRDQIQLEYTASADDKDDLERIEVEIDASSSHFSVDVEFKKKSSWFGGWNGSSGEVEFRLKVPHEVVLKMIDSVNGNVAISDVYGDIKAETVNGKVKIENAGSDVSVDTVNGDVKIVMQQFKGDQRIKSESVNGDIEVYLPENEGFRLDAETLNGDLSNDFGIEVEEGKYVGADMEGRYKSGNARLLFDTVNGDIEVRKD